MTVYLSICSFLYCHDFSAVIASQDFNFKSSWLLELKSVIFWLSMQSMDFEKVLACGDLVALGQLLKRNRFKVTKLYLKDVYMHKNCCKDVFGF